jgi:hypothetical protein
MLISMSHYYLRALFSISGNTVEVNVVELSKSLDIKMTSSQHDVKAGRKEIGLL